MIHFGRADRSVSGRAPRRQGARAVAASSWTSARDVNDDFAGDGTVRDLRVGVGDRCNH
jgi:hypothetical protein